MAPMAFTRCGTGPPLVLLHAMGLSRVSWNPVVPALADRYDVVAVDLPGFGESPPLPSAVAAHPRALASRVAALLDELGIVEPHIVGNSLGGWVALESAHGRATKSLTLLSPAGLWARRTPLYDRVSLRATRWLATRAGRLLSVLVQHRFGRVMVLGQTHGRPTRTSPRYAQEIIATMAACPGFEATFRGTANIRYLARADLTVPVTVVFGSRDRLLLRQSRHLDQLPTTTLLRTLPGCGHIPMRDDPAAVVAAITDATRR